MSNVSLFLGFPVSLAYARLLQEIEPKRLSFFTGKDASCVQEIMFEDKRYLGKFAPDLQELPDLILLEKNIYSILNKWIPNYIHEQEALILLAIPSLSTTAFICDDTHATGRH